jgi:hypothetical protein
VNLAEELSRIGDPVLTDGVVSAIGPVANKAEVFRTVVCHYVDYNDPSVLTVYLVSAGRVIRHQWAPEGPTALTTCLSMERVARVSEQRDGDRSTVIVETDADRVTLTGMAQTRPASGEDGNVVVVSGNLFPAGWVIEAQDPKARARLAAFTSRLRASIAS